LAGLEVVDLHCTSRSGGGDAIPHDDGNSSLRGHVCSAHRVLVMSLLRPSF